MLIQRPFHRPLDAVLQAHQGLVPQPPLRLGDVVVPRHAAVHNALAVEGRRLADGPEEVLAQETENHADAPREGPDVVGALRGSGGVPYGAGEIPKVDGAVVGDEEGLAVDALVVERDGAEDGAGEEGLGGEEMGVGDVLDVGEVEEVLVVADLHVGAALLVDVDHVVHEHHVAFAHDARGADRAGEEVGGFGEAVRGEDELFGGGLWVGS